MSLKAKIEAVIYASEEPVTLAQLIGLLGEEGQSELDTQQPSLALEDESSTDTPAEPVEDADALNAEILAPAEQPVIRSEDESQDSSQPKDPEAATTAEPLSASDAPETDATAPDAKTLAAEAKARERKLRDYFRSLLEQLIADYATNDRGLEIREVAGGFRLATKPEYHDAVRGFVKSLKPPLKLSLQALETLAVVAYKQPVTAPEVSEIRGVESAGTLGSLMTRKLVTTAGRKQVIGRPILYKTTKDFLVRFGLKDINELPSIEEFEKMASELTEAVQEEIQMEDPQSSAEDNQPDTLATPEGDNEGTPEQPLPAVDPTPLRPRGDEPHSTEPLYPPTD